MDSTIKTFNVDFDYDGVPLSGICRWVGEQMQVEMTAPMNGIVSFVCRWPFRPRMIENTVEDEAIEELQRILLDLFVIDRNMEKYRKIGKAYQAYKHKVTRRNAELKSEVVTGLILISTALIILLASRLSPLTTPLLGLGLGIVGTRFLLFFIKLSRHCQRGTSQSTFMLGWESGLALGVGLGYYCFADNVQLMLSIALSLVLLALAMYVAFTHQWFVTHKNR